MKGGLVTAGLVAGDIVDGLVAKGLVGVIGDRWERSDRSRWCIVQTEIIMRYRQRDMPYPSADRQTDRQTNRQTRGGSRNQKRGFTTPISLQPHP